MNLRLHAGQLAKLKNVRFCVSLSLGRAAMMATELEWFRHSGLLFNSVLAF